MTSIKVVEPVKVVETEAICIEEYFGRVADKRAGLSACVATIRKAPSAEAYQTPAFDELVMVLEGRVELHHEQGVTVVKAGQGAFLPKLTRVKWVWPVACKYVPICLPAFSPSNCFREDEDGDLAKTSEAMDTLRQLHARVQFPYLLHVAKKSTWEESVKSGATYYPPTFEKDGNFTHATDDPSKLIQVLNHFYKSQPDAYVCLRMTLESLEECGVETVFEHTSPVGDTPAVDMGDQLFPHIQGGIPPNAVLDVFPVARASDGTFLSVPGLIDDASLPAGGGTKSLLGFAKMAALFAAGIALGAFASRRK